MNQKINSNLISLVIVIACISVGTVAARVAYRLVTHAQDVPITVYPKSIWFNRLVEGVVGEETVYLTNRGDAPLQADRIVSSCGCTTTEGPKVISPLGQGKFVVHYDSHDRRGKINQSVSVYFSGHRDHPVSVPVAGNVERDIELNSPFVSLANGAGEITMKRLDGEPLRLTVVSTPDSIKVVLQELSPESVRVRFTTTLQATAGTHQEDVVIGINHPGLPQVTIPVSWTSAGKYKLVPDTLNFGLVPFGAEKQGAVRITGPSVSGLRLISLPPSFTGKINADGPNTAALNVRWSGKGGKRLIHANVTLSTGDVTEPRLVIPVYAAVNYTAADGGCTAKLPCKSADN